ncbi:protein phosphatase [Blumeria hordei DH14]|uniref:Protein phosphatase n=1 Tax=Blumeria graminis f. sp. hordei (strain DH14) TaxID=546991 RepID=N1J8H1_BLUG1|nr:protein phosphatase [Blumeria hordei DH14]
MTRAIPYAILTARIGIPYRALCRSTYRNPTIHNIGVRRFNIHSAANAIPVHMRKYSLFALLFGVAGCRAWYSHQSQSENIVNNDVLAAKTNTPKGPMKNASTQSEGIKVTIGTESLSTDDLYNEEPISKRVDESGKRVLEKLTPLQATQKLRRNEESYLIGRGRGVMRYDVVQIPSNDPIEDDHSEKIIEVPYTGTDAFNQTGTSGDWMFWGVYDGHSGWTTSAKLRQVLINYVARELNSAYKNATMESSTGLPSNEAISAAMKTGFLRLDNEIVNESVKKTFKANTKLAAAKYLTPALSGSCALLSFYDSISKLLHVACTGDSRAILGRRDQDGKWTASPLTVDQTGNNPDEEARLRSSHPGEEHVIRNGRVLGGLEPTRAFGDASYKWSREISEYVKEYFFGRTPSKLLQTPPYVTAEPVVSTTQILPEKGDFVVMATDGLWEMLSNEEVVDLVGQWIQKQSEGINGDFWKNEIKKSEKFSMPITLNIDSQNLNSQKTPIRQKQWGIKTENERFVVQDKNAATHLVRNALGGNNSDLVSALLSLTAPYSRRYRDDLTVEVIFFGNGENSGEVTINKEASATKMIKSNL